METLTKLGRKEICKRVGITNPDSIFISDKKAFIDRMDLYRVMYNMDEIISLYKQEVAKCKSEREYIKKLNKSEEELYVFINKTTAIGAFIENLFSVNYKSKIATFEEIDDNTENLCRLKFYFDSPVFEAFKFLVGPLNDSFTSRTLQDVILEATGDEFLAKTTKDLDINRISNEKLKKMLKLQMGLVTSIMMDVICPKYMNQNNILKIGLCEMEFVSNRNKSVQSINSIMEALHESDKAADFTNIKIRLYESKQLAANNSIELIKDIIPKNESEYNVNNYDQYTLIQYLRKIRNESKSEYDDFIEINGAEVKITHDCNIAWYE